jgi:hypothetical protein
VVHRVFERGLGQAIAAEIELHRGTGRVSARCRSKRATTSNVTRDATRVRLCASPRGALLKICRVEKRTRFSDAKIFSIQRRRLATFGETRQGKSAV